MAIFTAATLVTIATVAAAAVKVSAVIGLMGMAVRVVGMITKNKDLIKAGQIMGYVGLAGGIAGAGVGIASVGMEGFGEVLSATSVTDAFQPPSVDLIDKVFDPTVASQVVAGSQVGSGAGAPLMNYTDPLVNTMPPVDTSASIIPPGVDVAQQGVAQSVSYSGAHNPYANARTLDITGGDGMDAVKNFNMNSRIPAVDLINPPSTPPSHLNPMMMDKFGNFNPIQPGTEQSLAYNRLSTPPVADAFPDWMKYSAMTGLGQAGAGLAGGWFQGAAAEQQLEFQKLQNAQKQAQIQRLNIQNTYAPLVQFGTTPRGVLNR